MGMCPLILYLSGLYDRPHPLSPAHHGMIVYLRPFFPKTDVLLCHYSPMGSSTPCKCATILAAAQDRRGALPAKRNWRTSLVHSARQTKTPHRCAEGLSLPSVREKGVYTPRALIDSRSVSCPPKPACKAMRPCRFYALRPSMPTSYCLRVPRQTCNDRHSCC
ncbi:hypothetical protein C8Q78DRAFT_557390 [Trametes maxima]|nr:hypothetical protein C8Q78DRAFT_557390 [Trametes maxima]